MNGKHIRIVLKLVELEASPELENGNVTSMDVNKEMVMNKKIENATLYHVVNQ